MVDVCCGRPISGRFDLCSDVGDSRLGICEICELKLVSCGKCNVWVIEDDDDNDWRCCGCGTCFCQCCWSEETSDYPETWDETDGYACKRCRRESGIHEMAICTKCKKNSAIPENPEKCRVCSAWICDDCWIRYNPRNLCSKACEVVFKSKSKE